MSHNAQSGTEEARGVFSANGVVHSRNATTVAVEKIPEERFNESAIRTFFSQFGNIIQVTLRMGPGKIAIVKYETHDSALAALKSPKAVFDNRFVQVDWYNDTNASSVTNGDSLGSKVGRSTGNGQSSQDFDLGAFFRRQEQAQKEFEDRKWARQNLEEERRKVEQRRKELQEQKKNYLEQCAAKGLVIDDESDDEDSGDITISTGGDKENQVRPFPISKEALKAKLAEVEAEARRLGIDPDDDTETVVGWVPPARGGYRGRLVTRGYLRGGVWGRGGFLGSIHDAYARYSIDNRPKSVLLTGVDFSAPREDEALRHHLLVSSLLAFPATVSALASWNPSRVFLTVCLCTLIISPLASSQVSKMVTLARPSTSKTAKSPNSSTTVSTICRFRDRRETLRQHGWLTAVPSKMSRPSLPQMMQISRSKRRSLTRY